uniref:Sucrose cleavage like protein n=1 Tax=Phaseolus vulgaris TaxID=3885 RepID=T2DNE2_PHAVU|nr:sucrose cleavage like protein [Phaseolus vulgaris]
MASPVAVADDAKNGFSRPEMYKENLAGTVDAYDRHVFLCYKNHAVWPPRIEASDADPLPKRLAGVWKARKNDIAVKTKITVCEAREEAGFADGDVLIFPDMIKYKGLEESNIEGFFDDVIVRGKEWSGGGEKSVLRGSHIFVCAHGSRDVRCGVCGPVLMDKLNEEIDVRGLKDQIAVVACSHVGGHKYAGNVIIFSPGPDGKLRVIGMAMFLRGGVPPFWAGKFPKGGVYKNFGGGKRGPPFPESRVPRAPNFLKGALTTKKLGGAVQGFKGVFCAESPTLGKTNQALVIKGPKPFKGRGAK